MPNAENAKLEYEAGQTAVAMVALTDQGDHIDFDSADNLWSRKSGYAPTVRPNGLATGGAVTIATSGSNNRVDTAALTCYLVGVSTSVAAKTDKAITRSSGTNGPYMINSITISSAGSVVVVAGNQDGAAFSTTRGADGGPPWIPTTSIEIAQIKTNGTTAAALTADEIYEIPNVTQEWSTFPTWTIDYSDVDNNVLGNAGITMTSACMLSHSDDSGTNTACKKVYAEYYTPSFAEVPDSYDFTPPANSHSISSTQVYARTVGAVSSSIGNGSFNCLLNDGISDAFLREIDSFLWFRFYPNRSNAPYCLAQGKLGVGQSFPAGDNINASCIIGAEAVADRVSG